MDRTKWKQFGMDRVSNLFLGFEERDLLEPEDWYIDSSVAPKPAGNRKGYWVAVRVFVKRPRKRRT